MKDFNMIEQLYDEAFPKQEQVPMGILLSRAKSKNIHFEAYYDGDIFIGFTYVMIGKDITYLFYLATSAEVRGKGYGEQILNLIKNNNLKQRLVLTCMAEDEEADDNDLRLRRQNFYLRNGYTHAGFSCNMNGNHMVAFTQNGKVSTEEFLAVFKKFWGAIMFIFFKPKINK